VVGIVIVSHSQDIANGAAELAGQMAGPEVRIEPAGGAPDGGLGTDATRVRAAIIAADQGAGVIILGDLGSAILTVRHVLEGAENGHAVLVDAPLVEGAIAAAVMSSAGRPLAEVAVAAEEANRVSKL
jgi:PTS hybrid protein